MFTQCDHVDAEVVGQYGLVDDLADRRGVRERLAGVVLRHVAEGVEAELNCAHGSLPACYAPGSGRTCAA
jgi:hypothetical protein